MMKTSNDAIRASSPCQLDYTADSSVRVDANRAIPIALITNELITNAAKLHLRWGLCLVVLR
jgi:two-component sensor histidine kinase